MKAEIEEILADIKAFDETPESVGLDLRLDLSGIVLEHLRRNGWTQAELARSASMKESQLSRLVHASGNVTFDVAGRIAHALGIRLKLVPVPTVKLTSKKSLAGGLTVRSATRSKPPRPEIAHAR